MLAKAQPASVGVTFVFFSIFIIELFKKIDIDPYG